MITTREKFFSEASEIRNNLHNEEIEVSSLCEDWKSYKNLVNFAIESKIDKDQRIIIVSDIMIRTFLEVDPQMWICR